MIYELVAMLELRIVYFKIENFLILKEISDKKKLKGS